MGGGDVVVSAFEVFVGVEKNGLVLSWILVMGGMVLE